MPLSLLEFTSVHQALRNLVFTLYCFLFIRPSDFRPLNFNSAKEFLLGHRIFTRPAVFSLGYPTPFLLIVSVTCLETNLSNSPTSLPKEHFLTQDTVYCFRMNPVFEFRLVQVGIFRRNWWWHKVMMWLSTSWWLDFKGGLCSWSLHTGKTSLPVASLHRRNVFDRTITSDKCSRSSTSEKCCTDHRINVASEKCSSNHYLKGM